MQSSDYVTGVFGWKIDPDSGEFEINSAQIQAGSLPSDPQSIVVTAGSWSEYELPANALERYAFIGAELTSIPVEYRDSAEFVTEDISFDRDGSDVRTTLTYERRETAEEVTARQKKAAVAGTTTSFKDGVMTITVDGVVRIRLGNLAISEAPPPFVVVSDQLYMSESLVKDGSITQAKIIDNWSVKMGLRNGKYVAAGFGLGLGSQCLVSADEFAIKESTDFEKALAKGDAEVILGLLAGITSKTQLGRDLASLGSLQAEIDRINLEITSKSGQDDAEKAMLDSKLSERVKELIREELKPGRLLHRN